MSQVSYPEADASAAVEGIIAPSALAGILRQVADLLDRCDAKAESELYQLVSSKLDDDPMTVGERISWWALLYLRSADPERDAWLASCEADGYAYGYWEVVTAVDRARQLLGVEPDDLRPGDVDHVAFAWPTGEVLAFERSQKLPGLGPQTDRWRDVSDATLAKLEAGGYWDSATGRPAHIDPAPILQFDADRDAAPEPEPYVAPEPEVREVEPVYGPGPYGRGERVAVVGSRDYPHPGRVRDFVLGLPVGTEVVSGGARGVDSDAASAAHEAGLQVRVFPADWEGNGKRAGYLRNEQIVAYADRVVAFWDGESPGTKHTIKLAGEAGLPIKVVGPDPAEDVGTIACPACSPESATGVIHHMGDPEKWDCPKGEPHPEAKPLDEPSPEQVELVSAMAERALRRTLLEALEQLPNSPGPDGATCEVCSQAVLGWGKTSERRWWHPDCVSEQLAALDAPADPEPEAAQAVGCQIPERWPGAPMVRLANGALESGDAFAARHDPDRVSKRNGKPVGNPACLLGGGPIFPGELVRKKGPKSSKRMHDACVARVREFADRFHPNSQGATDEQV